MRRVAAILLVLAVACLGSGVTAYLHEVSHLAEAAGDEGAPAPAPHDEQNCPACAQIYMPALPAAWTPMLFLIAVLLVLLGRPHPLLVPGRSFLRVVCRGPPAWAA